MAGIDQFRDKNHEVGSMSSQHGAPQVLRECMKKTKKGKGTGRRDVGWQHSTAVDGNMYKVKCNYCGQEYSGGVFRIKHHLAGTYGIAKPCRAVPNEVRQLMLEKVNKSKGKLIEKRTASEDVQDNEEKNKLMTCIHVLEGLEGIGSGPFTKALKILKEDSLWRDVFLALSDDRKKDFVQNL